MKPRTLAQQAQDIVELGANRNPHYDNLNTAQRERLTAAALRDASAYANEYITNLDEIVSTAIIALETKDTDDRKELLIKLGELVITGAMNESKKAVEDALDNAVTQLALIRQFHDDDYEVKRMLFDDNRQRARDMNLAAQGR